MTALAKYLTSILVIKDETPLEMAIHRSFQSITGFL